MQCGNAVSRSQQSLIRRAAAYQRHMSLDVQFDLKCAIADQRAPVIFVGRAGSRKALPVLSESGSGQSRRSPAGRKVAGERRTNLEARRRRHQRDRSARPSARHLEVETSLRRWCWLPKMFRSIPAGMFFSFRRRLAGVDVRVPPVSRLVRKPSVCPLYRLNSAAAMRRIAGMRCRLLLNARALEVLRRQPDDRRACCDRHPSDECSPRLAPVVQMKCTLPDHLSRRR